MELLWDTNDRESLAILTCTKITRSQDIPLMWLEAPKSMIQESSHGVVDAFRVMVKWHTSKGGGCNNKCFRSRHKPTKCVYLLLVKNTNKCFQSWHKSMKRGYLLHAKNASISKSRNRIRCGKIILHYRSMIGPRAESTFWTTPSTFCTTATKSLTSFWDLELHVWRVGFPLWEVTRLSIPFLRVSEVKLVAYIFNSNIQPNSSNTQHMSSKEIKEQETRIQTSKQMQINIIFFCFALAKWPIV